MELLYAALLYASIFAFVIIICMILCAQCAKWAENGNNSAESRDQENFQPSAIPISHVYQPITISEQYLRYLQNSQNRTAVYSIDSETSAQRFTSRSSEFDPPPSYSQIFGLNQDHYPSENSHFKPTAPPSLCETDV